MTLRLLFLLLGLAAHAPAAPGSLDKDWIGPENPAYALLQQAQMAAPQKHFGALWLSQGKSLPQATARLLADRYLRDPRLDESLRQALRQALPSEVEVMRSQLDAEKKMAEVAQQINNLDSVLGEKEVILAANHYSPVSSPGTWITFNTGYEPLNFDGLIQRQRASVSHLISAQFNGQVGPAGFKVVVSHQSASNSIKRRQLSPMQDLSLTLDLNNEIINGMSLTAGFVNTTLSKLLWSSSSYPYQSSFYQNQGGNASLLAESPSGDRNSQGLLLRKQGTQMFWPFEDARLILAPDKEHNHEYNRLHGWESALRLDSPSLGFVPGADGVQVFGMGMVLANDKAHLQSFEDQSVFYGAMPAVLETNVAYGAGIDAQIAGGGSLVAEYAVSTWNQDRDALSPTAVPQILEGSAYFVNFTKSFGRFGLGMEYAAADPKFVPGGHRFNGISYGTTGMVRDTLLHYDLRDNTPNSGHLLAAEEPAWISNNTQKMGLQLSWTDSWGSLVLGFTSSMQMLAGGPWIRAGNSLNNSPYNGFSWFEFFENEYTWFHYTDTIAADSNYNRSLFQYNRTTLAPAINQDGSAVDSRKTPLGSAVWQDLEQLEWRHTSRLFWLSEGGLGSSVLAKDSVKAYNTARLELNLELATILNLDQRARLVTYYEVRDSALERRLALAAQPALLLQTVTGADLSWQVSPMWEMVSTGGYETFFSDAGFFAVRYSDVSAGVGFNALFDGALEGMRIAVRLLTLSHMDSVFPHRNFTGWRANIGTSYTFAN